MSVIRLFVGLELPAEVKDRLRALAGGIPGARWRRRDQLHLTLRFIGEVDGAVADDIAVALTTVRTRSFAFDIASVGLFGKITAARLLWAGIAPTAPVIHLHERIEQVLVATGLPPAGRKFAPHITLARLKGASPSRLGDFLAANDGLKVADIPVAGFGLFSSLLSPAGAIYRVEARYPFD